MASGHVNCTQRPVTWMGAPTNAAYVKKVLANSETVHTRGYSDRRSSGRRVGREVADIEHCPE